MIVIQFTFYSAIREWKNAANPNQILDGLINIVNILIWFLRSRKTFRDHPNGVSDAQTDADWECFRIHRYLPSRRPHSFPASTGTIPVEWKNVHRLWMWDRQLERS